jgi:hypothetical protein
MVHKEVACLYCPVFEAAFKSDFIEGQTQTYKLEDITVDAFQYVVYWFYSQKLKTFVVSPAEIKEWSTKMLGDKSVQPNAIPKSRIGKMLRERCFSLCRVWVLADRLQIPRLQNLVTDELERTRAELGVTDLGVLNLIYDPKQLAVPKGAVLREYFVETIRNFAGVKPMEACQEFFPRELLLECVIAYKRAAKGPDPFQDRAEFKKRFHVSEDL